MGKTLLSLIGYDAPTIFSVGVQGAKKLDSLLNALLGRAGGQIADDGKTLAAVGSALALVDPLAAVSWGGAVLAQGIALNSAVQQDIQDAIAHVDHFLQLADNNPQIGQSMRVFVAEDTQPLLAQGMYTAAGEHFGRLSVFADTGPAGADLP